MKTKIKKTLLLMMSLMLMASVVFTGCGETEEKEEKKDKKDKKEKEEEADETVVSSVEDLLDAIEPGVTIRIEDGNYNLTEYIEDVDIDDFNDDHKYVYFRECYDGYELVISGVDDLTIYSDIEDEVEIQVEPRYAVVLNFDACTNIYLKHLIVGHTEEEAYCTGAVLNFSSCENISLNGMDLYGCCTYGIEGDYTDGIYVSDSVIRDCSYGLMYLQCCTSLDFESCSMYGCDGYNMIDVYSTQGEFNDCSFYDNTFDQSWNTFIALSSDNDLVFNSCYFGQQESISIYKELLDQPTLTFNDCTFEEVTGSSAIPVTPVDVQVSSVEELLDEIAPYTFITVEAGQYNLTDYIDSIDIDDFNDTHEYVQITEVSRWRCR